MKIRMSYFMLKTPKGFLVAKSNVDQKYRLFNDEILLFDRSDIKQYFSEKLGYNGQLWKANATINQNVRLHCYEVCCELFLIELESSKINCESIRNKCYDVCYLSDIYARKDEFEELEKEFLQQVVDECAAFVKKVGKDKEIVKSLGEKPKEKPINEVVKEQKQPVNSNDSNEYESHPAEKKVFPQIIEQLINDVELIPEPSVPFPQANDFKKVLELVDYIGKNKVNKDKITEHFAFTERQTDYYVNAGVYLGVLKSSAFFVELTDVGLNVYKLDNLNKKIEFAKLMLSHEIFNVIVKTIIEINKKLPNSVIVEIMKEYHLYHINSDDTYLRRASTISKWIDWLSELENSEASSEILKEFENFVLHSRFNYSFKLVFMYSILNNIQENGDIHMDDIYVDYMGFYWNRTRHGLKIDKQDCIYTKSFLLDKQKLISHIVANPLDAYIRQGYLTYDRNKKIINLPKKYVGEYKGGQIESLKQKLLQRIDEYYSKL